MTSAPTGWTIKGSTDGSIATCYQGKWWGKFIGQAASVDGTYKSSQTKTFSSLPPHYSLSFQMVALPEYSWDLSEFLNVHMDGTLVYKEELRHAWGVPDFFTPIMGCSASSPVDGMFLPIAFNKTHTASTFTVKIGSTLNQYDEWYYLGNIIVSVDTCHPSCLTCNGPSENNCVTCPTNASKSGSSCQCNAGYKLTEHTCINTSCPAGTNEDTAKRICDDQCAVDNCNSCTNKLCTACASGYFLLKGKCFDRCPWFAPASGSNCVDTDYAAVAKPYLLAEDFINSFFNHADVMATDWVPNKVKTSATTSTTGFTGIPSTNHAGTICDGRTLVGGYNWLTFNTTCSPECNFSKTFSNLPVHYKATLKYEFWYGDTWDSPDEYFAKIDNTEVLRKNYNMVSSPNQRTTAICGRNRPDLQLLNQIGRESVTVAHQASSLIAHISWFYDQESWDEWAGLREIQLYLHQCENDLCKACTAPGQACTECYGTTGTPSSRIPGSTGCPCPTGHYHIANQVECEPCVDMRCDTCSNKINCDTCIGSTGQPSSRVLASICICPDGYYDTYPTQNECQICSHPCQKCSGTATTCTQCIAGANRKAIPDCNCEDGFFENAAKQCVACDPKCGTCVNTSDNCLTCTGANRLTTAPACLCSDTYYDNNTQADCIACSHPCQNCSSSSTCLTCRSQPNRGTSPPCSCNSGYFELSQACPQCSYQCNTCETSNSNCLTCKGANRSTQAPACLCNDGFYDDGSNSDCVTCIYPCSKCQTSNQNCTECKTTANRGSTPNCECNATYYDDGAECQKCQHPCVNCSALNTCTSCIVQPNRATAHPCGCLPGYFENTAKECQQCDPKCGTCVNTSDNCLTCTGANRLTTAPACLCSDTYYDNNTQADCVKCNYPCVNCSDAINCTSCDLDANRLDFGQNCICKDSYYDDNTQCQQCSYKCSKCETNDSNCSECSDITRENTPTCSCKPGYFDVSIAICEKCDIQCGTCENQSDNCLTCESASRQNPPQCDCAPGFYDDGVDPECLPCQSPCQNCYREAKNCISCLDNDRQPPYCDCQFGYFENSQNECEKCSLECSSCENSANNCITCAKGLFRNEKCQCQDGTYSVQGQNDCEVCLLECETCKNGNTCKTCDNKEFHPPLCKDRNYGYEVINDQGQVQTVGCMKKCKLCTNSSDNCTECNGLNRENNAPECSCLPGFQDNEGMDIDCQECGPQCLTCVSYDKCSSCREEDNRILNKFTNECECAKGFKSVNRAQACTPCYQFQDQCLLECPTNTIIDKEKRACREIKFEKERHATYIYGSAVLVALFLILAALGKYKLTSNKFNRFQKLNQKENQQQQSQAFDDEKEIKVLN